MNVTRKPKSAKGKQAQKVRVGRRSRGASRRAPIAANENLYLLSLADAVCYPGAKIPDLVSIPSSTFQTENYGVLTSNAVGDLAFAAIPRLTEQTYTQTSATTTWTWPVTGTANPQQTTAYTLYESVRPVSMKLRLDYIGSTAADQGSIAANLQARPMLGVGAGNESANFPTTFATLLQAENSYVGSARNGMEIIWVPQDNADLVYCSPIAGGFSIGDTSYNDKLNNASYPYVIMAASGLAFSTASFRYTLTVNWEALAAVSTLAFIHSEPSPVNLGHLQDAFNWAQNNVGRLARRASDAIPYLQTAYNGLAAGRALGAGLGGLALQGASMTSRSGMTNQLGMATRQMMLTYG